MKSISFMFKKSALLLAALMLVCSFGLFTSCQQDDDDDESVYELEAVPEAIVGTWKAAYGDIYVISKGYVESYSSAESKEADFTVKNVEIAGIEGKNAFYLYGKVESSGTWTYGDDSGTYGTVGNYKCFYVEIVNGTAIKISQGFTSASDMPTLEEAKNEYTEENSAYYSKPEYTKQ